MLETIAALALILGLGTMLIGDLREASEQKEEVQPAEELLTPEISKDKLRY